MLSFHASLVICSFLRACRCRWAFRKGFEPSHCSRPQFPLVSTLPCLRAGYEPEPWLPLAVSSTEHIDAWSLLEINAPPSPPIHVCKAPFMKLEPAIPILTSADRVMCDRIPHHGFVEVWLWLKIEETSIWLCAMDMWGLTLHILTWWQRSTPGSTGLSPCLKPRLEYNQIHGKFKKTVVGRC